MADKPETPLEKASKSLEEAISQLSKAAKPVEGADKLSFKARMRVLFTGRTPKPVPPPNAEVDLIYDECRDIYTRLAGLCADAELAA
jgi:hypothetical protein